MSSPCTKSTTMLSSPWTLWRPSTHMMTHESLGSLRMWSWCSRTCNWGSSSLTAWSLTRSSLVSFWLNEASQFDELDRAELDQGWGYITFLAKGEKKMVTFRQLEILFGFTMEKVTMEHQGKELQRVGLQSLMECTLPQGPRLLRSGAQCLRYVHKALANTFFARKATGQSMREK
ncbi:unnamed protein product [Microthlaspi erraticum]|uniref:Arabidopsis retrotransposon Orf1 C-terminal domain-containing protein n=1 Tax=Microthlaspi erraticum TaxID=1685480 RepID=A0A6D2I1P3_9BRAS|nr:unnamed protein product [Microthlaspi erraticum]